MLKVPTCENCKNFRYKGLRCKEYPQGIPEHLIFVPIEALKKKCNHFQKIARK